MFDAETLIYITKAGRRYQFSTDPLTAAALLRLVHLRASTGKSTLLHATADFIEGIGTDGGYVYLGLTSLEDLVIEAEESLMADTEALEERHEEIRAHHAQHGYVALPQAS